MTRFELATPATRTRCATRLRYIPKFYILTAKLSFCSGALPLSQKRYLIVFVRQSATSRQFIFNRKTYVLLEHATPLLGRYLIVLVGRVPRPDLLSFQYACTIIIARKYFLQVFFQIFLYSQIICHCERPAGASQSHNCYDCAITTSLRSS